MVTVDGILQDIIYENERGTFTVAAFAVDGDDDKVVRAVGSFAGVGPGEELRLHGEWVQHDTYGLQFSMRRFELAASNPKADIGAILSAASLPDGGPKGGPGIAERILDAFGPDALGVLSHDAGRLRELPGVGEKRAAQIKLAWDKHSDRMWGPQTDLRGLALYLQMHVGDASLAQRIYGAHGEHGLDMLRGDPYAVAGAMLPFTSVDPLATKLGARRDAQSRIAAGIVEILLRAEKQGHVYCDAEALVNPASDLLALPESAVAAGLERAHEDGAVVVEGSRAYRLRLHDADVDSASRLRALAAAAVKLPDKEAADLLREAEKQVDVTLSARQREAVTTALGRRLMVLTGGPGTGKTTTVRAILAAFHAREFDVALCAPTGRAARRLSEVSGGEAQTIHRLLGYSPDDDEYRRDAEHPIDTDAVIVDEFSMVDTALFGDLLAAVPRGAHLVLVGDSDQLPSVGPGSVLEDIIDSGVVPVVALDEIFRQAQGSLIVRNAHAINQGEVPTLAGEADRDCFLLACDDPDSAADSVVDLCSARLPTHYDLDPVWDIQVLAPMRRRQLGTETLNERLQKALNPAGKPVTAQGSLRAGDKVMQIVNNYDKDVFNGDIGQIDSVDARKGTVWVRYPDGLVGYERGELGEITLAYATTVHKSQGSEYRAVVLALHTQHHVMLQRRLLYTAVTRARELLVVVGAPQALERAVANDRVSERRTTLRERLVGRVGPTDAAADA
ncbi:ATP-dependent RecD-like DNA helicase [Candidatus Poribacteria bacterium]|jgi:exodeoxyribonuclease V alpha subunit|nr:ATP-dependent RecD-like DNA helicase [Candidatus Poribacteria bacterium]MBT5536035.1 ATP-dependent RecD-like DNA helicase [Candidatus Poribacteria bacterium]MBT7099525.1 ATP-dependent RecD-like DNA helicase [Candidatus Poribacteria bacterium]